MAKENKQEEENKEEDPGAENNSIEVPIEEEKAKSFNGLAGEFYNLIHHMNKLPDLLLFIDARAE